MIGVGELKQQGLIHVVEDDVTFADSLSTRLLSFGFEVQTHRSPAAFVQSRQNAGTCCLLLSIEFPTANGLDFLELMPAVGIHLPVILMTQLRPGDTVAVIGVGGVGLNAISGARLAGASQIIAIDLNADKEALARRFGATHFINPAAGDPIAAVRKIANGGVDHAFEVIGLAPTSQQAVQMLRIGGGAYLIGLHRPGVEMAIQGLDVIVRQVKMQGVYMGSSNIKIDVPMYADLYLQGRLNLDDLISRTINIREINEAYEDLKRGAVARSVITSF